MKNTNPYSKSTEFTFFFSVSSRNIEDPLKKINWSTPSYFYTYGAHRHSLNEKHVLGAL